MCVEGLVFFHVPKINIEAVIQPIANDSLLIDLFVVKLVRWTEPVSVFL